MKKRPIAYSYRRVSSRKQVKEGYDDRYAEDMRDSLDNQYENAANWCEENDIELDTKLVLEDKGVSAAEGHNIAHGKLHDFLVYCREGVIKRNSYLLFDTWSRGSRGNLEQQLNLVIELFKHDIIIVTLQNRNKYTKDIWTTDQLKIYGLVSEMLAANQLVEFLRNNSKRAHQRHRNAVSKGKALKAKCPSWLMVDDGTYIIVQDKVKIVRRIFTEYSEGSSSTDIAKGLNEDFINTLSGNGRWHSSTVSRLLRDRAVIGYHQFQKVRIEDSKKRINIRLDGTEGDEEVKVYKTAEDVIDIRLWDEVKQIRKLNKGRKLPKKSYSILAKLPLCGYHYTAEDHRRVICELQNRSSNPKASFFQSYAYREKSNTAVNQHWTRELLEEAFIDGLGFFSLNIGDEGENYEVKDQLSEKDKLSTELNNISSLIERKKVDVNLEGLAETTRRDIYLETETLQNKAEALIEKVNKIDDKLQEIRETNLNKYEGLELKKRYKESKSNDDIVRKLNLDFRKEISGILLYNYGYKFDFVKVVDVIDYVNFHIVHHYKITDKALHIHFNDFVNLNQETYEACPFLFWDLINRCVKRAYMNSSLYKKHKGSDKYKVYLEGQQNAILMGHVHRQLLTPSSDKANRFFAIMSKTAGWAYIKPMEDNIERNNKTPSYVYTKYAYCKQTLYVRRKEDIKYFLKGMSIKAVIPKTDTVEILGNDEDFNIIIKKTLDRKDINEGLEKRTPSFT